jgi:hypothetical protein
LPKFYYKPLLEKINESYLENAKKEYSSQIDIESNVRLIVEADSQEVSDSTIVGFVDIRMWELTNENQ